MTRRVQCQQQLQQQLVREAVEVACAVVKGTYHVVQMDPETLADAALAELACNPLVPIPAWELFQRLSNRRDMEVDPSAAVLALRLLFVRRGDDVVATSPTGKLVSAASPTIDLLECNIMMTAAARKKRMAGSTGLDTSIRADVDALTVLLKTAPGGILPTHTAARLLGWTMQRGAAVARAINTYEGPYIVRAATVPREISCSAGGGVTATRTDNVAVVPVYVECFSVSRPPPNLASNAARRRSAVDERAATRARRAFAAAAASAVGVRVMADAATVHCPWRRPHCTTRTATRVLDPWAAVSAAHLMSIQPPLLESSVQLPGTTPAVDGHCTIDDVGMMDRARSAAVVVAVRSAAAPVTTTVGDEIGISLLARRRRALLLSFVRRCGGLGLNPVVATTTTTSTSASQHGGACTVAGTLAYVTAAEAAFATETSTEVPSPLDVSSLIVLANMLCTAGEMRVEHIGPTTAGDGDVIAASGESSAQRMNAHVGRHSRANVMSRRSMDTAAASNTQTTHAAGSLSPLPFQSLLVVGDYTVDVDIARSLLYDAEQLASHVSCCTHIGVIDGSAWGVEYASATFQRRQADTDVLPEPVLNKTAPSAPGLTLANIAGDPVIEFAMPLQLELVEGGSASFNDCSDWKPISAVVSSGNSDALQAAAAAADLNATATLRTAPRSPMSAQRRMTDAWSAAVVSARSVREEELQFSQQRGQHAERVNSESIAQQGDAVTVKVARTRKQGVAKAVAQNLSRVRQTYVLHPPPLLHLSFASDLSDGEASTPGGVAAERNDESATAPNADAMSAPAPKRRKRVASQWSRVDTLRLAAAFAWVRAFGELKAQEIARIDHDAVKFTLPRVRLQISEIERAMGVVFVVPTKIKYLAESSALFRASVATYLNTMRRRLGVTIFRSDNIDVLSNEVVTGALPCEFALVPPTPLSDSEVEILRNDLVVAIDESAARPADDIAVHEPRAEICDSRSTSMLQVPADDAESADWFRRAAILAAKASNTRESAWAVRNDTRHGDSPSDDHFWHTKPGIITRYPGCEEPVPLLRSGVSSTPQAPSAIPWCIAAAKPTTDESPMQRYASTICEDAGLGGLTTDATPLTTATGSPLSPAHVVKAHHVALWVSLAHEEQSHTNASAKSESHAHETNNVMASNARVTLHGGGMAVSLKHAAHIALSATEEEGGAEAIRAAFREAMSASLLALPNAAAMQAPIGSIIALLVDEVRLVHGAWRSLHVPVTAPAVGLLRRSNARIFTGDLSGPLAVAETEADATGADAAAAAEWLVTRAHARRGAIGQRHTGNNGGCAPDDDAGTTGAVDKPLYDSAVDGITDPPQAASTENSSHTADLMAGANMHTSEPQSQHAREQIALEAARTALEAAMAHQGPYKLGKLSKLLMGEDTASILLPETFDTEQRIVAEPTAALSKAVSGAGAAIYGDLRPRGQEALAAAVSAVATCLSELLFNRYDNSGSAMRRGDMRSVRNRIMSHVAEAGSRGVALQLVALQLEQLAKPHSLPSVISAAPLHVRVLALRQEACRASSAVLKSGDSDSVLLARARSCDVLVASSHARAFSLQSGEQKGASTTCLPLVVWGAPERLNGNSLSVVAYLVRRFARLILAIVCEFPGASEASIVHHFAQALPPWDVRALLRWLRVVGAITASTDVIAPPLPGMLAATDVAALHDPTHACPWGAADVVAAWAAPLDDVAAGGGAGFPSIGGSGSMLHVLYRIGGGPLPLQRTITSYSPGGAPHAFLEHLDEELCKASCDIAH